MNEFLIFIMCFIGSGFSLIAGLHCEHKFDSQPSIVLGIGMALFQLVIPVVLLAVACGGYHESFK